MSPEQLRIRPAENGTIRELNIPKDKLEKLEKIVSSPKRTDDNKKLMIKKLANASPCCVCGGIPAYEISFPFHEGGITRVERYCTKCIERVYSREQVL